MRYDTDHIADMPDLAMHKMVHCTKNIKEIISSFFISMLLNSGRASGELAESGGRSDAALQQSSEATPYGRALKLTPPFPRPVTGRRHDQP